MAASCVPSRTTGVAPLAVFFDCSGSTSVNTSTAFHDCDYVHNFGDTTDYRWQATNGSGAWGNSWGDSWWDSWGLDAPNKNVANGPSAVHVYESAGTYSPEMLFIDAGTATKVTNTITVDDPAVTFAGVSTICVSASSVPVAGQDGAPTGCSSVQNGGWDNIVNTYAAAGRRVLLNRAETYSTSTIPILDKTGPGIIGAYGTGAKPVIHTTLTTNNANLLRPSTVGVSTNDWRLMDLDFDGESDMHRNAFTAVGDYPISRLLFLRVDAHDLGGGFLISVGGSTPSIPDEIYIVDSTVQHISTNTGTGSEYALFLSGSRYGVLGNVVDDTIGGTAQHLLRVQACDRGAFSHNILKNSANAKEMFALRGADVLGTGPYPPGFATEKVVASRNQIETNTFAGVRVDTEVTGILSEVRDVIVEGNYYPMKTGGGSCVRILADRVAVRNEIAEMHLGNAIAFDVRGGSSSASNDVWLYNNSIYSSTSTGIGSIADINGDNVSGLFVRNNLLYRPNAAAPVAVRDLGTGNSYVSSNNLTTNPLFFVDPPVIPSHFALTSSSPAISTGLVTTVYYDFFGTYRNRTAFDIGAYAWNTGTQPSPTVTEVRTLFMYPKLDGVGSDGFFIGNSVR